MEGVAQNSEFAHLLQQASALKTQQLLQSRRKFESFPTHVQHTLYHSLPSENAIVNSYVSRTLRAREASSAEEKLVFAEDFKRDAREKFGAKDFVSAVDLYERALGVFTYVLSTSEDWRTKGIKDEEIELHEESPCRYYKDDEVDRFNKIRSIKSTCLSNLATCYFNMGPSMVKRCIEACDCALEVDDSLSKVYYRRARARVLPASSGATELEAAIGDARRAAKLEPRSKEIRELLSRLLKEKENQKRADAKTFQGLFGRKELRYAPNAKMDRQNVDPNVEGQVAMFKEISRVYEKRGKMKEAQAIYEAAEKAANTMKDEVMDWDNPTEKMIKDAQKYDLDLTDPLVIAELKRLEKATKEGKELPEDGPGQISITGLMSRQLDSSINFSIFVGFVVLFLRLLV